MSSTIEAATTLDPRSAFKYAAVGNGLEGTADDILQPEWLELGHVGGEVAQGTDAFLQEY